MRHCKAKKYTERCNISVGNQIFTIQNKSYNKKKEGRKADRYVDTFVQIKQKDKSETNGTGYLQRVGGNGMEIMEGCVRDRNE